MPKLKGISIVLDSSAVETAVNDVKQSLRGLEISVRVGGLCNTSDDFNRAGIDRSMIRLIIKFVTSVVLLIRQRST